MFFSLVPAEKVEMGRLGWSALTSDHIMRIIVERLGRTYCNLGLRGLR
jgi:hypothetical protein